MINMVHTQVISSELMLKESRYLRSKELYFISLAIGMYPFKALKKICSDLKLDENS